MAENKARLLGEDEAIAQARYVRMSPTKVRRVVNLIRELPIDEARAILKFDLHAASGPIAKCLDSAAANAEHNKKLDPATLWVKRAYVEEGPSLKRLRIRARGLGHIYKKRTSHIVVVVESRPEAAVGAGGTAIGTQKARTQKARTQKTRTQKTRKRRTR